MNTKAQIGVADLAVMGENLLLNMAEKGSRIFACPHICYWAPSDSKGIYMKKDLIDISATFLR